MDFYEQKGIFVHYKEIMHTRGINECLSLLHAQVTS